MLNAIWTRMFGLGRGIYHAVPWTRFISGLGAGGILLALFQQFLSQLGTSPPVVFALWCVAGLAWAIAWNRSPTVRPMTEPSTSSSGTNNEMHFIVTHCRRLALPGFLVLAVAFSPRIWAVHGSILSDAGLESPGFLLMYVLAWACLMIAIPVWCAARLAFSPIAVDRPVNQNSRLDLPSPLYLVGLALGVMSALWWNRGDLWLGSLVAGMFTLIAHAMDLRFQQRSARVASPAGTSVPPTLAVPQTWQTATSFSTFDGVRNVLVSLLCGGMIVWLSQTLNLLMMTSLFTFAAIAGGILMGIALGFRLVVANPTVMRFRRLWTAWVLLALQLILTAGFTFAVYRLATVTGSVSQVWMLQGFRDLLVIALTLPVGLIWSLSLGESAGQRRSQTIASGTVATRQPLQLSSGIAGAVCGGLLMQSVLIPLCGLTASSYTVGGLLAGLMLLEVWRHAEFPRLIVARAAISACGLALLCGPLVSQGIRPEFASRLLFSTNVFQAEREGTPRSQLPFLDDARLELVQSTSQGVLTVWKSAVSRYQIRENGIPRGVLSTRAAIAPQASAEVLTSLIPMTLHEDPRRVALLGAGAGVPLFTCLGSLDASVTLVDADTGLLTVLKQLTANTEWDWVWKEERLRHVSIDPALWVSSSGEPFDVVISNTDQSALLRTSGSFTQEFYRRAATRLTADGIFCQRFIFHDLGPNPLRTVSATMRSVFTHVAAVEMGPGEIAFVATNSSAGLIRKNCVDRMQALFSSDAMSGIGWDWSVLLTLGAFDAVKLDAIEATGTARIHSAANSRFSTQLPPEVMRWGHKSAEVAKILQPNTDKILNWLGEVSNREDLLRRLAEVRGQQELLSQYPDQYWAYRSQVRKQVSTRPMSLIEKVNHEKGKGGLHPEDKRRLRYFQQLSRAIHTKSPVEIERLEAFTTPYDPLVSLFVHQELAEIAARVPESDPRLELEHRLHTLFFTSSADRSVRNALAALRLILDKPEAVTDATSRYDTLNTVLQALQYRWEARTIATTGNPKEVARDVEENIVLGERAMLLMAQLAPEAGIATADREARQRVIERKLLQPLRTYRTRLEPHLARQKMKAQEAEIDGDLPTDEELQFPGADK